MRELHMRRHSGLRARGTAKGPLFMPQRQKMLWPKVLTPWHLGGPRQECGLHPEGEESDPWGMQTRCSKARAALQRPLAGGRFASALPVFQG